MCLEHRFQIRVTWSSSNRAYIKLYNPCAQNVSLSFWVLPLPPPPTSFYSEYRFSSPFNQGRLPPVNNKALLVSLSRVSSLQKQLYVLLHSLKEDILGFLPSQCDMPCTNKLRRSLCSPMPWKTTLEGGFYDIHIVSLCSCLDARFKLFQTQFLVTRNNQIFGSAPKSHQLIVQRSTCVADGS